MTNKERVRLSLSSLTITTACVLILACSEADDPRAQVIAEIQASHIEANAPARADFDRLLRRDLAAYLLPGGSPVVGAAVEYELLRDGPTQSGVAYPKYYAWVQVKVGGAIQKEGAARLAAIERERFEVTDFLSREDIAANPSGIYQVFPGPVCQRIEERMQQ